MDDDNNVSKCAMRNYDWSNKELNFASAANQMFRLPTDNDSLAKCPIMIAKHSMCLRKKSESMLRSVEGKCSSTLDVLAWLMDETNDNKNVAITVRGGLTHMHREK